MTAELLLSMGFNQRTDLPHPTLRYFDLTKNGIKIHVQMFPDNRWAAFVVLTEKFEGRREQWTISRHLTGITEAFQLRNFLQYL